MADSNDLESQIQALEARVKAGDVSDIDRAMIGLMRLVKQSAERDQQKFELFKEALRKSMVVTSELQQLVDARKGKKGKKR